MKFLKWILIGLFVAGSVPMLGSGTQYAATLPLLVLWAGFLYWLWRI